MVCTRAFKLFAEYKTMLRFRISGRPESGTTLIETLIALATRGVIAVIFLGGLLTTARVTYLKDERSTAMRLAQRQIEGVKACVIVS